MVVPSLWVVEVNKEELLGIQGFAGGSSLLDFGSLCFLLYGNNATINQYIEIANSIFRGLFPALLQRDY